jgi:uncharacterized protein (TIGR03437 family)
MISRTAILAILSAASLTAQCTLFDQTGCSLVYTAPANPSLATYLADAEAAFQYTNASIAKMPQPKILLTAQIVPAVSSWFSTSVPVFGAAIQKYMGMLQNDAGVSTQDVNIWGTPFVCDPSYSAFAAAFTPSITPSINVPCDCGGGAALAKGAAVPAGSGPHCTALAYYDGMFQYASANGITIRTGWYPGADEIQSCGLAPATAGGVFTEAQFEECMIPFMQAGMTRSGSAITAVQVLEEPTAGMLLIQNFNLTDTAKFIQDAAVAVKAIAPGTQIGAAATEAQNSPYWSDWLNPSGTGQYLDFLVADIFSGTCDDGPSPSGVPYYAGVLSWWQTNYLAAAKAYNGGAGKPVRIGQSDPPVWCQIGGLTNQFGADLGEGDVVWENSGLHNEWLWTFMHWASAMGIQSASPYCDVWFFNYTGNQQNDRCTGQWSGLAMANLSPTPAAAVYKQMGAQAGSLSGSLKPPAIASQTGVVNGASFQEGVSAGSWAAVQGTNLSYTTRSWNAGDLVNRTGLPTSLDGVFVTVDGKPAYVGYVSPTQVNFVVPADSNIGAVDVRVTTTGVASNTVSAQLQTFSPAFFLWNGKYAAATHLNFAAATSVQPGETIVLWGTGFGPTNPPEAVGQLTSGAPAVTTLPAVTIGGVQAQVLSAVMSPGFAGLYQLAVQVPGSLSDGDQAIVAQVDGVQSPANVWLTVQQ